ncbi:MAG: D-alanyl-D-alanine carboxypeptidase/D-alanyl-D-alanine-endopeptidase, partial [Actinomycetota bacterium]|nr:D-alanyl-D-alanine carboxypeptidase/D-alanyl-D-alanine-endopeptidase [Actinomycetota bacterium]
ATPGHPGPGDPAAAVGAAFVAGLRAQGVGASLSTDVVAPPGAATVGSVSSAPVADQLALALDESDNALAESLTRQAAFLKGTPPGFAQTAAFVRSTLTRLGVDVSGVTTVDASGLSRENAVPARVLADVLALGTDDRVPGIRETVRRLPVAGLSGTLGARFDDRTSHQAAGVARAKTGTLTGVSAVSGTVVTAEGRLLTFTVLANGVAPGAGTLSARDALDQFVAALASCGCRS